ncbi:MAG: hypothetical protein HZB82_09485 [Deltaproteobacteria bacterium]|nr:hypothetical protein [Deltaproteobacteria bacterium]
MSDDVKICPECGAEFFAHATNCNKCEVALILPGQEPPKKIIPQGEGEFVAIMTGPCDRLRELSTELDFIGIENKVLNTGGASCAANEGYGLFVPASLANISLQAIEDFKIRIYPELRQAEERFLNGQCPACGADISSNPVECPDCGLNLSGGGGGGGCSDDSCGSCGGH